MRVRSFLRVVLTVTLAAIGNNSFCQTARVSFFRKQFYEASTLKDKRGAALDICGESHSIGPDSLYCYSCFARTASEKLNDLSARVLAHVFTEVYQSRKNLFDSALALCHQDLKYLSYRTNGDGYSRTGMQECVHDRDDQTGRSCTDIKTRPASRSRAGYDRSTQRFDLGAEQKRSAADRGE
jgi:hypothetical protein